MVARLRGLLSALLVAGMVFAARPASCEEPTVQTPEPPRIEVVFVLDTTGSMESLIGGAKQKIWSIANQIMLGKPSPRLRIGLVGYRDIGDEYVTKVFDLTDDLDGVFRNLMGFEAAGGGDGPEHVNKALHDGAKSMTWTNDKKTLKIMFLVGDAPPHVDYADGFDYKVTVLEAATSDIVVHTIRCGNDVETETYWKDIARRGEGTYTSIEQSGGMTAISTPMDDELAKLGRELDGTFVGVGSGGAKAARELKDSAEMAESAAPSAAADRAECKARAGMTASGDLIDDLSSGKVKLEQVKTEELPENMKPMSAEERQKYLDELHAKREEIKKKIADVGAKRDAFIKDKLKQSGGKGDSFDQIVMQTIFDLAKKKGITYGQAEETPGTEK
ncbi:MAG: VWA domain-containing protein [Planctomycetota bacterium]|nr:VWA domain-containing protein [Planctomycetota bacterium]